MRLIRWEYGGRRRRRRLRKLATAIPHIVSTSGFVSLLPNPCALAACVFRAALPSSGWSSRLISTRRRFRLTLHGLFVSGMSAGKEQPQLITAADSTFDEDDTTHGPGRLGVNLATSQCQLEAVRRLHNSLDPGRDYLERSACQTAAGRALWNPSYPMDITEFSRQANQG